MPENQDDLAVSNGKVRVIVLDDHPVVREGLIYMIEKQPDLQVVAESGTSKDAIALVESHKPDILLLDIQMETPTFNIVKKAKAVHAELKVLFITAFFTKENVIQADRFGAFGLVSKLEGARGICEALRQVAQGKRYFSENADKRSFTVSKKRAVTTSHPLSPREVDVLCCVAHAMTAKEIANDLNISVKTVDRHKANIMEKLSMRSQIELARYAIRHGFVDV